MATGEIMKSNESQEQISAGKEIAEKAGKFSNEQKTDTGNLIDEGLKGKEKTESTELLKNFKYKDLIKNQTIQEALKFPEDTEQVKKIQLELGYKPGSKNYYPEEHWKDMKEADGMAGPYTMDALNNMIAEGLTSNETQQLSKDFDNKTDKEKSEQANKILDAYLKFKGFEKKPINIH